MPPAAVESQHELSSRPLAQRMALDERLELGDERRLAAEGQLGVDALLEAGETVLFEPRLLQPGERLRELRQRHPAPQVERPPQHPGRLLSAAIRQRFASPRLQRLESVQIERVTVEVEAVPRRARLDQLARQALAELGDEDLHHLGRAVRHLIAPEPVDEVVHRHDPARLEQQEREQRPLLAAGQVERACVVCRFERPEYAKVHVARDDYHVRLRAGVERRRLVALERRSRAAAGDRSRP